MRKFQEAYHHISLFLASYHHNRPAGCSHCGCRSLCLAHSVSRPEELTEPAPGKSSSTALDQSLAAQKSAPLDTPGPMENSETTGVGPKPTGAKFGSWMHRFEKLQTPSCMICWSRLAVPVCFHVSESNGYQMCGH